MDSNAFDALLDRAHTYWNEVYATSGERPTHFMVTDAEYLVLLRSGDYMYIQRAYMSTPDSPMRLMGMAVCSRRAWCPEMEALQNRAAVYATQYHRETGYRPDRWFIPDADYECLVMHLHGPSRPPNGTDIWLLGMRVVQRKRMTWIRGHRSMCHLRMGRPARWVRVGDHIPSMADMSADVCSTDLPRTSQAEVSCPCGEVIWDLSTCWPIPRTAWVRDASPPPLPSVDSETTPIDEWEAGVMRMITDVRRRQTAKPRHGG